MEAENIICFCCRNINCDGYTIYRGYLMCEYCLDDWLKTKWVGHNDFELWCIKHKEELDKEMEEKKK